VDVFVRTIDATIALHECMKTRRAAVLEAAAACIATLRGGGKVLLFGNGGSAADAEHAAAELVGRFERVRGALAAISLTANTSVLTSVSNDEAYERVFARQIEAFGRPGDLAIGISTSGASANVVLALEAARQHGLRTIALTGRDGGPVGRVAEIHVNVPSESTPRVQEVHRTLLHIMCQIVEDRLA